MLSPVQWVVADTDTLIDGVRRYIDRHGLPAFLEEYYNLIGTRSEAVFTEDNVALARSLGLSIESAALLRTVPKQAVHKVLYWAKVTMDRKYLARFFADRRNMPELSDFQRLFLEWHFLAPLNYSWTLVREPRQMLVGWNDFGEFYGGDDFAMHTNLMGCTGVFALVGDGSAYLSHYDDDNLNPAQIVSLMDFLRRFPGAQVYTVGVHAEKIARVLYEQRGVRNILTHVKQEYRTTSYWVRFARKDGQLHASHCVLPVTEEYIGSTHYIEYGRWFIYGQFGKTLPKPDSEFVQTEYVPFDGG